MDEPTISDAFAGGPRRVGSYVLFLRVECTEAVVVGRLGVCAFAPGYYAYTGSALGGLDARIARHRSARKRMRWHVDYLLQRASVA